MDPERLLADLDPEQRAAAIATHGPVVILAGAGSGKTRVVTRRVAYAIATGAVEPGRVLLVTFTEKAAAEMAERVRLLGQSRVTARTFHSAALAQLRHFWPLHHDGASLPAVLAEKWRIVSPLARRLPGGYRFTATRDLIGEIEWAKSRCLTPDRYASGSLAAGRMPPLPVELFVRLYRDYERLKTRQGYIDFDDILILTVELLRADEDAIRLVRGRYTWFTVDEYQDTNPLQQQLLDLWVGDRRDLCVVGDEDQTIYTFAGAAPEHLTGFADRYPDALVFPLLRNYRSTPQVLELANRLIAATGRSKRLVAALPDGAVPSVRVWPDANAELAGIAAAIRKLITAGVAGPEIAVLVRLNAQIPPVEAALTRAGIPYRVRGQRFFERRDVKEAIGQLRGVAPTAEGPEAAVAVDLVDLILERWHNRLGFDPDATVEGTEARERQAALSTLLSMIVDAVRDGALTVMDIVADLARRDAAELSGSGDGVELLTLHRAKGLEWDAVFLPSLEEGLLPVGQAADDITALAEERRLLYVGITRARVHLTLSWAQERASAQGKVGHRKPSRFLADVAPRGHAPAPRMAPGSRPVPSPGMKPRPRSDDPLLHALRGWRTERARADQVPPYVVFHDTTLAHIAEWRPCTATDLRRVPGIGQTKLDRYGTEIIAIVEGHPLEP
jgi:DNA helicase II / ATP-dependent DNA helicase PcrA